jgi:1,4-dihydroxy-2-naphthoate polyprenyltransferase
VFRTIVAFVRLGRPLFLVGGLVLYALGAAVAAHAGATIDGTRYLAGQLAVTAFQLMTHYANDYFDYEADSVNATPTRWSGGSRVLVAGVIPRRAALLAALTLGGAGLAMTLYIGTRPHAGALVVPALLTMGGLAWAYSAPPFRLCATGLGELDTAVVVTGLVPFVGLALQDPALRAARSLLLALLPLAALQLAMLLAIELPDAAGDARAGKRTLVVRWGGWWGGRLYAAITASAYLMLPALAALGLPPGAAAAPALMAPIAWWRIRRVLHGDWRRPRRWEALAFWAVALLVATSVAELTAFTVLTRESAPAPSAWQERASATGDADQVAVERGTGLHETQGLPGQERTAGQAEHQAGQQCSVAQQGAAAAIELRQALPGCVQASAAAAAAGASGEGGSPAGAHRGRCGTLPGFRFDDGDGRGQQLGRHERLGHPAPGDRIDEPGRVAEQHQPRADPGPSTALERHLAGQLARLLRAVEQRGQERLLAQPAAEEAARVAVALGRQRRHRHLAGGQRGHVQLVAGGHEHLDQRGRGQPRGQTKMGAQPQPRPGTRSSLEPRLATQERARSVRGHHQAGGHRLPLDTNAGHAIAREEWFLHRYSVVGPHAGRGAGGGEEGGVEAQPPLPQAVPGYSRGRRKLAGYLPAEAVVADPGERGAGDGIGQAQPVEHRHPRRHDPLGAGLFTGEELALEELHLQAGAPEQDGQRRPRRTAAGDHDVSHWLVRPGIGKKRGLLAMRAR